MPRWYNRAVAITVYQYPKCSTCRTALKWLDKQGIAHDKVDIVTSPPSKAELEKVAKVVGVRRMFNTSGESYRNGNFKAKLETMSDADAIAALLHGDLAHVNLIPMNPVAHTPWTASPMPVIERFAATLRAAGVPTTIRRNRGQEIGAACGQLAAERAGEPAAPAVERRRELIVRASAAALRGERSHEPVPAGLGE